MVNAYFDAKLHNLITVSTNFTAFKPD